MDLYVLLHLLIYKQTSSFTKRVPSADFPAFERLILERAPFCSDTPPNPLGGRIEIMGREEQVEEREVLDSIFPEEITGSTHLIGGFYTACGPIANDTSMSLDLSDTSYRISITLDTPESDAAEGEEDAEQPILILQISYPTDYPDVAPELEISAPHNAPKHPRLDIQEDRDRLLEALQPTIEENIGMAMVFTLVSALKDSAELLMAERANAVQAEKEVEAAKAEEEENRKFEGTAVTVQSFLEWHERFRKEMEEEEQRRREEKDAEDKKTRKPAAKEEKKLTGRQLWERGLAGKGDFDEDDDDSMAAGVDKVKIAA